MFYITWDISGRSETYEFATAAEAAKFASDIVEDIFDNDVPEDHSFTFNKEG